MAENRGTEFGCPIPGLQVVQDISKRGAPIPNMQPVAQSPNVPQVGAGNQGTSGNQSSGASASSGSDKK
jgi:hypothetical protein